MLEVKASDPSSVFTWSKMVDPRKAHAQHRTVQAQIKVAELFLPEVKLLRSPLQERAKKRAMMSLEI